MKSIQSRRKFLRMSSALSLSALSLPSHALTKARVVVIGGGFGGATAAKYIRYLSNYQIDVILIEPDLQFISCPLSNLVIGGSKLISDISQPYTGLVRNHGIQLVHDFADQIDFDKKLVSLAGGSRIPYDKLVVSPGIDLNFDSVNGLRLAHEKGEVLHAWRAGKETDALRRQLQAMPDGGVFAMTIPEAPYRCPPGPYERACQIAWYFKNHKPNSKVIILDANQDIVSKAGLFKKSFEQDYKDIIEYRNAHKAIGISPAERLIKFEVQPDLKADVINVLPEMRAGTIALKTGLANTANNRWCGVKYLNFESQLVNHVHVIGDSIQISPLMPKSGHMANNHAKVAATAIVAELSDIPINPSPVVTNTCYSFIDDRRVVHVASVHEYVANERTFKVVSNSGGLSAVASELEGNYAETWAKSIWSDMLT
jgi:sulfide dehydrogenase [flavocytochrome c] flavoprotein subunit